MPDTYQPSIFFQKGKGLIWLPAQTVKAVYKKLYQEFKAAEHFHGIIPLGDGHAVQFRSKAELDFIRSHDDYVVKMALKEPLELTLENLTVSRISCDEVRGGRKGYLMEIEVHLTEAEVSRLGQRGLVEHYCDYIERKDKA